MRNSTIKGFSLRILIILAIVIAIAIAKPRRSFAEDEIASGIYDGVPWRVTSNYELVIGEAGKTYTINERDYRGEDSWPWENYSLVRYDNIVSAKVVGKVYGTGSLDHMFNLPCCKTIDVKNLDTSAVTNMTSMFWYCEELEELDISTFDTSKVTSMREMFETCGMLKLVNLSALDTSNVKDMGRMFCGCESLVNIDLSTFDTSNVNYMNLMFAEGGFKELDLSSFDSSNVTNMGAMFADCKSLEKINFSRFSTKNATNLVNMFLNCESLRQLDLTSFDTKKARDMGGMFQNCKSLRNLNISSFDTRSVYIMESMFRNCNSLSSISLAHFNMSKVEWDYDEDEDGVKEKYYRGNRMLDDTTPEIINTPLYVKDIIKLPYVMYDQNGNQHSSLPMNLNYSIKLYKYKPANGGANKASGTSMNSPLPRVKLTKVSKGKKSFTAKWKKAGKKQQKQFSGYQIQYSNRPDFSGEVKSKSTTKKSASKVVIRKLKKKTKYYVRIRRYKRKGGKIVYSEWSNVKSVRTK